jgi:hypothetical protein
VCHTTRHNVSDAIEGIQRDEKRRDATFHGMEQLMFLKLFSQKEKRDL